MDTNNEILDAIEILADKKIGENITKVLTGICTSVNINNNTCVMNSNGVSGTVYFYGSPPEVNGLYRIFVPSNDMSRAFVIVPPRFTVNPNLLDNWYFANPVNQRGQTSYTGAGYTVDRWRIGSSGTLIVHGDYITFNAGDATILRNLEEQLEHIPVGTYTLSTLMANGNGANLVIGSDNTYISQPIVSDTKHLVSMTFTRKNAESVCTVFLQCPNKDVAFYAAKLEFGSTQTLAHLENGNWVLNEIPDYGEQLRRCQRYFVRLGFSNTDYCIIGDGVARDSQNASIMVPLPTKMRTNYPVASLTGRIILRHSDVAIFVSTTAIIDAGGVGATLLKCVTSGLTTGDAVEAFLEPQNYLDLSADL
nr:MAG TPA: tail fiber protein [Caudoviricetes sp.]